MMSYLHAKGATRPLAYQPYLVFTHVNKEGLRLCLRAP